MSAPLAVDLNRVDPALAWAPWLPDAQQPWSAKWAGHLFRRAGFGAGPEEISLALKQGFSDTLNHLLRGSPDSAERYEMLADLGEEFARDGEDGNLRAWWLYGMLNSGHSLREKLTLFWHNHFATSINKVRSLMLMFRQNMLIRKHSLGKFGPFLGEMSQDIAMLIWLDSNKNVKAHPNENYAREVMELFSLGVGNYTEKDIQEAARAFTGWHTDSGKTRFEFNEDDHDDGRKTVLGATGRWKGDDIVRIILEQPAAPKFLVGKIYRDFVSEIQPPKELLEPLAERFHQSDYDIADLIETVLRSRLFYSDHAYKKRIKSPVEMVLGAVKAAWTGPLGPGSMVSHLETMGQNLFAPPNVKGWPGGKHWLNDTTLLARNNFAEWIAVGIGGSERQTGVALGASVGGVTIPLPPGVAEPKQDTDLKQTPTPPESVAELAATQTTSPKQSPPAALPEPPEKFDISMYARKSKAVTPKQIVNCLAEQFFPGGLNSAALSKVELYLAGGSTKAPELNRRIREACHAMMCMPEFQLG